MKAVVFFVLLAGLFGSPSLATAGECSRPSAQRNISVGLMESSANRERKLSVAREFIWKHWQSRTSALLNYSTISKEGVNYSTKFNLCRTKTGFAIYITTGPINEKGEQTVYEARFLEKRNSAGGDLELTFLDEQRKIITSL